MEPANIRDVLTSFSPSLDFLAISSGDGRIKIWDTIKGHVQTEFADIVSTDESDFFTKPEGGHLSVDYTCMKWLALEKKKKRKLRSSLLILGTGGGDVLALDVSAGQLKWRVSDCHPGGVTAVSFPANGSCVYTAGVDGMICQLDSITGNLLSKFKASTKAISSMSVSPDGKVLATAAAQLKIFSCSDHKKMQKFSGHPGSVRCMTFTDEGKYVISSASNERHIAIWKIDSTKNKSSSCILSMDHPAIFLDTKSTSPNSISVLAISETGTCYLWHITNMEQSHNIKPTKISMGDKRGTIFSAKLQTFAKNGSGNVFVGYGLLVKPCFGKVEVESGVDLELKGFVDGVLVPLTKVEKSKKGVDNRNQITALDRANTERALLPSYKISDVGDDGQTGDLTSSKDDMEMDEVTVCFEDRLKSEGILTTNNDVTSNKLLLSKLLKGINLESNIPQKQMVAAVTSLEPIDAYKLLKVFISMWQSRSIDGEHILPWISCLLINHKNYIKSQEPTSQLLDSLHKLTKSKGEVIQSLLQLSGRLQLFTAQINKAADKNQILKQDEESESDNEDDEEEEVFYDEEDESSENNSDDDK